MSTSDAPAPLTQLLTFSVSLLRSSFSLAKRLVAKDAWTWASPLYPLISLPISLLLAFLAPFTIFAQLFVETTLLWPMRTILWLGDTVYPLYVLVGVACITGILLGGLGRLLTGWLVGALELPAETGGLAPKEIENEEKEQLVSGLYRVGKLEE